MKPAKRKRLETAGWKVGSAKDFLGLTPDEAAFVELKPTLCASLKERRQHRERKTGHVKTQLVTWSNMNFNAKDAREFAKERKEPFKRS